MIALKKVIFNDITVLTSLQIAEVYGTTTDRIKNNFKMNKDKYQYGKHYIVLTGEALKAFKSSAGNFDEVRNSYLVGNRASTLYLWTEKGALLHAKSLNTDKAWQAYEYLVDFYFNVRDKYVQKELQLETKPIVKPMIKTVVDVCENPKVLSRIDKLQDDLTCISKLLDSCKMFISEGNYIERKKVINDLIGMVIADFAMFNDEKVNLIQKQY